MEVAKRRKFLEEITFGFKEIKESSEAMKQDIKSIFHILTGIADTLVLILESSSLGKAIGDEREELLKKIFTNITKNSPINDDRKRYSKNISKIGTRMIRTASSNFRIHSKKLKGKERKMFIENMTPSNITKPESEVRESNSEVVNNTLLNSTVYYKGDNFEMASL